MQYLAIIDEKLAASELTGERRRLLLDLRAYGCDLAAQHQLSGLAESAG